MTTTEGEARKALNRLRRALEKSLRELDAVVGALRHVEADDFPGDAYASARDAITGSLDFLEEEEERLRMKILQAGGLEPGRVRRSSAGGG